MGKPRVFISHSARGEPETLQLLDDLRKALEVEFAVLIDKDNLEPGDPWRQTLNTWIGACDVAIVLLTPKALASEYVAYEATILSFREKSLPAQKCTLIPVFLDPVNDAMVRAARGFGAAQIAESQAVVGKPGPEMVEKIRNKLAGLTILTSPLQAHESYLEAMFRDKVPKQEVYNALGTLKVDVGGWGDDPERSLALAMISRGLDEATISVIVNIRSYINNRERLNMLFEILATSWIDLRSSRRLEEIALGGRQQRQVALNTGLDFIVGQYVWRAGKRPPTDPWNMTAVTATFGEAAFDPLHREIETSLRRKFVLEQEDDLQDTLDWYEDVIQHPVFVALPAAGLNASILNQLRTAFPTLTFVLMAGSDRDARKAIEAQSIELLEPGLSDQFDEKTYVSNYNRNRREAVERYLKQHGL
jgi:hypothetical protein